MLADLEKEQDTAAFRWDCNLQLADDGSPVRPIPETSTFLCGKPALRK
jgi:hypothetical protein